MVTVLSVKLTLSNAECKLHMMPYLVFIVILDIGNPSYPRDTGFWWFGCKDKSLYI